METMPGDPPPPSQYQSYLAIQLSNFDELSDNQKICCYVIIKLGKANGTNETPHALFKALLKESLQNFLITNSWNANRPNKHAGAIRARCGVKCMTQVGMWSLN